MAVTDNYFIGDVNFTGHENEFEKLISMKPNQNKIYYFMEMKALEKGFLQITF